MAGTPACKAFIPSLSPYADGELTAEERVTVERHLSACTACAGRVADLRATSGLVRIGLDFAADEVDWKDFTQKVMAGLTPYKPPLWERLKTSASEMFLYQRGALVASFATAAAILAIVGTVVLREGTPLGYASEHMVVESVQTPEDAHVAPVVMTTEGGDAIIWVVEHADAPSVRGGDDSDDDDEDDEEDAFPTDTGTGLDKARPTGGEL